MVSTNALISILGVRMRFLTKIDRIKIDGLWSPLHYRITCGLLFIFCAITSWTQFFGSPIACITSGDVPSYIVESYCWVEGTFTLATDLQKSIVQDELEARGIAKYTPPGMTKDSTRIVHDADDGDADDGELNPIVTHKYYQWVCLMLFFQGCSFYVFRLLWKVMEDGRMECMIQKLNYCILPPKIRKNNESLLLDYMVRTRIFNNNYALKYFICQFLSIVHIIVQLKLIDLFLGGEFSSYGWRVFKFINHDPSERMDPMVRVFPTVTKCTFHRYGPTGDVMKYDNLCLLPLNIINEKVYVFLWFWLIFLLIVSSIGFMYEVLVVAFPKFKKNLISRPARSVAGDSTSSNGTNTGLVDIDRMASDVLITNCITYGDVFLFYLLEKNLDPLVYRAMLGAYLHKIRDEDDLKHRLD